MPKIPRKLKKKWKKRLLRNLREIQLDNYKLVFTKKYGWRLDLKVGKLDIKVKI